MNPAHMEIAVQHALSSTHKVIALINSMKVKQAGDRKGQIGERPYRRSAALKDHLDGQKPIYKATGSTRIHSPHPALAPLQSPQVCIKPLHCKWLALI
jgi:hypothetical protein